MPRRLWLLVGAAVLAASVVAVLGAGAASTGPIAGSDHADQQRQHLVVVGDDGSDLVAVPVDDGDQVALEYTHSVERTLVTDVYVVDDGALVDDRMLFSSFGAGLPSHAEVTRDGDRYVYEPPEQRHDPLVVSTGHIAGHELVVDGDRYDLAGRADGATVSIRIESRAPQ